MLRWKKGARRRKEVKIEKKKSGCQNCGRKGRRSRRVGERRERERGNGEKNRKENEKERGNGKNIFKKSCQLEKIQEKVMEVQPSNGPNIFFRKKVLKNMTLV